MAKNGTRPIVKFAFISPEQSNFTNTNGAISDDSSDDSMGCCFHLTTLFDSNYCFISFTLPVSLFALIYILLFTSYTWPSSTFVSSYSISLETNTIYLYFFRTRMPRQSKLANDKTENYPSTQISSVFFKHYPQTILSYALDLKNSLCVNMFMFCHLLEDSI